MRMKTDKFIRFLARMSFIGLIIFELLNQFKILHFSLDFTWFGLVITAVIVWLIVEIFFLYLIKKHERKLASWTFLAAVIGVYFDALGDIFHLYGKISYYDQIMHFLGGIIITAILFSFLKELKTVGKIQLGLLGKSFFAVFGASFFGALYEVEEYLEDYFRGTNRLGDGPDTANDLMLNILGALSVLVIIFIYRYLKRKT